MEISKYGITLTRLQEEDLEMVRTHRNADYIQRYMAFREPISPEQQRTWFQQVNNNQHLYFIIRFQGKACGLINSKNIQWNPLRSEAGLFIWEQSLWNTSVPALSTLILLEIAFYVAQAAYSLSQVLRDNPRAQSFNKQLGYELLPNQEHLSNPYYKLTSARFHKKTAKIIRAAETVASPPSLPLSIHFNEEDFQSGIADLLIKNARRSTIKTTIEEGSGRSYHFHPMGLGS
ncbi:MAG: hypothetical protein CSA95_00385 [Bacteroidetes bacterium]|nr:MAG: hypothetical protein CSA95_00385 [Bacteroidota bacterium]